MTAAPTIAYLKTQGVDAFHVTCSFRPCFHSAYVTFEAAGIDDAAEFPSIVERRRFVCSKCGGRAVSIMPDWRRLKASGLPH